MVESVRHHTLVRHWAWFWVAWWVPNLSGGATESASATVLNQEPPFVQRFLSGHSTRKLAGIGHSPKTTFSQSAPNTTHYRLWVLQRQRVFKDQNGRAN